MGNIFQALEDQRRILEELNKREMERQEREIIKNMAAAGQITAAGFNTAVNAIRQEERKRKILLIANAGTAAAIRKAVADRDDIEIIVSPVMETSTVCQVVDEDLKQQLLESIEIVKKGDKHHGSNN